MSIYGTTLLVVHARKEQEHRHFDVNEHQKRANNPQKTIFATLLGLRLNKSQKSVRVTVTENVQREHLTLQTC